MFGDRVRAAMKAADMRSQDIAGLCRTTTRTVRRWLRMKHAPRPAILAACIAHATGADLMQLILGSEKNLRPRKYSGRRGHFWPRKRAKSPARNAQP